MNSASKTGEIKNILKNMKFAVVPNLIKQDSTLKHINIQNHFFDKLITKNIYGKIINIDLENVAGTATVELTFNGVKKLLNAKYTITKNIIELNTTFNLNDFNAVNALDSLARQCYELHKGTDGISKTWPDIDISVVSILDNGKL